MSRSRKKSHGSQLAYAENESALSQKRNQNEDAMKDAAIEMEHHPEARGETNVEGASSKFLSSVQKTAEGFKNRLSHSFSDIAKPNAKQKWQKAELKITTKFSRNWQLFAGIRKENAKKDFITSRNYVPDDSNKYRRGPLAVEDVSSSSLHHKSNGIIDSDDEDDRGCRPSSKGLLTYFKELGKGCDEDERVDLEFVSSLFEAGADINHQDRYGQTALHAVARDWHMDIARFFLEHGAIIDKADEYGRTPLHLAASVDHFKMVEFLVLNGANVEERAYDGQTPLHFAAKNSAVNAIKTLIRLGAHVNSRDKAHRTPLFIAAESGRAQAAMTLLDFDAPAGVYDNKGNSAMANMVEKMPQIAYAALAQFFVDDKALRRKYYYLNQLESARNEKEAGKDHAKTALEMIVVYKETELVMHPVIQKLINTKWNLFARRKSWIDLIFNLVFTLIWLILAILLPRDGKFHTPVSSKAWRIVLEAILLMMSFYFTVKEAVTSRNMHRIDSQWREWMARNLEDELENCHPKWPDERKYIESEISRVWKFRGTHSRNIPWSIYEWMCHASVLATAAAEIYYELNPTDKTAWKIYAVVLSFSLMMVCLRLMKMCRAFTFLSAFIVLLGHVLGATLKFAFLFFEFFIPYVCILWVIFGGQENAEKIDQVSPGDGSQFESFGDIIYITWLMTVTADIPFTAMVRYDRELSMIIVGTYYALVSVVCINLYIALMSETFTRAYENAEANASLQQALLILYIERQLSQEERAKIRKHFRKNCSPMEQNGNVQSSIKSLSFETEAAVALGNVDRQLTTLAASLEKQDRKEGAMDNDSDENRRIVDDLKQKSRILRKDQHSFLDQMKDALDDVSKTQENVTKTLKAILSRGPQAERSGRVMLRRTQSSQSIS